MHNRTLLCADTVPLMHDRTLLCADMPVLPVYSLLCADSMPDMHETGNNDARHRPQQPPVSLLVFLRKTPEESEDPSLPRGNCAESVPLNPPFLD